MSVHGGQAPAGTLGATITATHPAVFGKLNYTSPSRAPQIAAPPPRAPGDLLAVPRQATASGSSTKPRVLFGSTGMPGPIVVVKVTFFR
jgi:hypothetical protein